MKLIAAAMITMACSMLGAYAASRSAARLRALENTVLMIADIKTRIEFVCMPVDDLLDSLCQDGRFETLIFLKKCKDARALKEPFPSAWEKAVNSFGAFSRADSQKLAGFGKSLGTTDLQGQIACCELYISLFEERARESAAEREKYSKALPALGVLGGLAFSILII